MTNNNAKIYAGASAGLLLWRALRTQKKMKRAIRVLNTVTVIHSQFLEVLTDHASPLVKRELNELAATIVKTKAYKKL